MNGPRPKRVACTSAFVSRFPPPPPFASLSLLAFQIQKTILNDHLPASKWTPKSALHDNFHEVVSSVTCRSYRANADGVYPTFWFHLIPHHPHQHASAAMLDLSSVADQRGSKCQSWGSIIRVKDCRRILLNLLQHLQNLTIPPSSNVTFVLVPTQTRWLK